MVGGGIAGSALATVLAKAGASVIVLERSTEYRHRVRGEYMQPWGSPRHNAWVSRNDSSRRDSQSLAAAFHYAAITDAPHPCSQRRVLVPFALRRLGATTIRPLTADNRLGTDRFVDVA
jgi:choline dehydrogenase-like flavoprotein